MTKSKFNLLALLVLLTITFACNQTPKQTDNQNDSKTTVTQTDPKVELEKWKKELIASKLIGTPCDFENMEDPKAKQWVKENPDQLNGLPKNDKDYTIAKSDFNNDSKEDLLLYFNSVNGTGHNGGTPFFAKIIYADGTFNSNIMSDIKSAIIDEFNRKRISDKKLKEITNNYLEETTSISFTNNKISGEFSLYTKDDAHCCPSYQGKYTYNPNGKKIEIQISEVKC